MPAIDEIPPYPNAAEPDGAAILRAERRTRIAIELEKTRAASIKDVDTANEHLKEKVAELEEEIERLKLCNQSQADHSERQARAIRDLNAKNALDAAFSGVQNRSIDILKAENESLLKDNERLTCEMEELRSHVAHVAECDRAKLEGQIGAYQETIKQFIANRR